MAVMVGVTAPAARGSEEEVDLEARVEVEHTVAAVETVEMAAGTVAAAVMGEVVMGEVMGKVGMAEVKVGKVAWAEGMEVVAMAGAATAVAMVAASGLNRAGRAVVRVEEATVVDWEAVRVVVAEQEVVKGAEKAAEEREAVRAVVVTEVELAVAKVKEEMVEVAVAEVMEEEVVVKEAGQEADLEGVTEAALGHLEVDMAVAKVVGVREAEMAMEEVADKKTSK